MIFYENPLLADDSHEIYLIFVKKLGKISQNLSSGAVVIGALRVKNRKMEGIFNYVVNTISRVVTYLAQTPTLGSKRDNSEDDS